MSLTAQWPSGWRDTLESKGSLVRFPVEAYIIILNVSHTERRSHLGEDHTNEMKNGSANKFSLEDQ